MRYKLPPRLYLALVTLHELLFYLCFATLKGEIETGLLDHYNQNLLKLKTAFSFLVTVLKGSFIDSLKLVQWQPGQIAKLNHFGSRDSG